MDSTLSCRKSTFLECGSFEKLYEPSKAHIENVPKSCFNSDLFQRCIQGLRCCCDQDKERIKYTQKICKTRRKIVENPQSETGNRHALELSRPNNISEGQNYACCEHKNNDAFTEAARSTTIFQQDERYCQGKDCEKRISSPADVTHDDGNKSPNCLWCHEMYFDDYQGKDFIECMLDADPCCVPSLQFSAEERQCMEELPAITHKRPPSYGGPRKRNALEKTLYRFSHGRLTGKSSKKSAKRNLKVQLRKIAKRRRRIEMREKKLKKELIQVKDPRKTSDDKSGRRQNGQNRKKSVNEPEYYSAVLKPQIYKMDDTTPTRISQDLDGTEISETLSFLAQTNEQFHRDLVLRRRILNSWPWLAQSLVQQSSECIMVTVDPYG